MKYVQPLTPEQRDLLDHTMRSDASFRARTRAHSLLLSSQGKTITEIAQTYQVHRVTVSSWITNWEGLGVQGLYDQPRSGRPRTLNPEEQELAMQYLQEEPRSLKSVVDRLKKNAKTRESSRPETSGQTSRPSVEAREKILKVVQRPSGF